MSHSVLPPFVPLQPTNGTSSKNVQDTSLHLRVLSYNVLAQSKAKQSLYPYCHPSILNPKRRQEAALLQIKEVNAHVVCLQDVDQYESSWRPELQKLGYDGVFNCTGTYMKTGVAVFYKREVFQLFQSEMISFNEVASFLHDEKGSSRYIQNNVGIIAALQPWEDSKHPSAVCIATVGLVNPDITDAKMQKLHDMQHQMLLRKLEEFNADFHLPIVLCGTFHTLPRSNNHRLLVSGAYGQNIESPHPLEERPIATPLGRSQIELRWPKAPYCGDTPITGYVVKRRAGGNGAFLFPVYFKGGEITKVVVCGLSSGTTYEFIVAATSYAGNGDYSQPTKPVTTHSNPRFPPRSRYLKHPEEAVTLKSSHHLSKQEDWYAYEESLGDSERDGVYRNTGTTPRYVTAEVNVAIGNRTDVRNGKRAPNVVHSLQLKSLYATQKDQVEPPTYFTKQVSHHNGPGSPICFTTNVYNKQFTGCIDYIYFTDSTLLPVEYLAATVIDETTSKQETCSDILDIKPKDWDDIARHEEVDYESGGTTLAENPTFMGQWAERQSQKDRSKQWLPNCINPSDHLPLCGTFKFNVSNLASMWN